MWGVKTEKNDITGLLFRGIGFVAYCSASATVMYELFEYWNGYWRTKNIEDSGVITGIVIVTWAFKVTKFPGTPRAKLYISVYMLTPSKFVIGGL